MENDESVEGSAEQVPEEVEVTQDMRLEAMQLLLAYGLDIDSVVEHLGLVLGKDMAAGDLAEFRKRGFSEDYIKNNELRFASLLYLWCRAVTNTCDEGGIKVSKPARHLIASVLIHNLNLLSVESRIETAFDTVNASFESDRLTEQVIVDAKSEVLGGLLGHICKMYADEEPDPVSSHKELRDLIAESAWQWADDNGFLEEQEEGQTN